MKILKTQKELKTQIGYIGVHWFQDCLVYIYNFGEFKESLRIEVEDNCEDVSEKMKYNSQLNNANNWIELQKIATDLFDNNIVDINMSDVYILDSEK